MEGVKMNNSNDCEDIDKMIFIYRDPFIFAVNKELKIRKPTKVKEPDKNEHIIPMCWQVSFGSGLITNIDMGDAFCEFIFVSGSSKEIDSKIFNDERYMVEKMASCVRKRMYYLDELIRGSMYGDLQKRIGNLGNCKKIFIVEED